MNDHIFGENIVCIVCGISKFYISDFKFSCIEIVEKSKTHIWSVLPDGIFRCEVCNILSIINIPQNPCNPCIAIDYYDNLYSCNEYLMIRANK